MKINFLHLKQEGLSLNKEEGNLNVEKEPMDDIKVATTPIEPKPIMNISQLLEYYTSIQSWLPKIEGELNKLMQMQLEVNKDLMCCKT